jgi:hypothetical protein
MGDTDYNPFLKRNAPAPLPDEAIPPVVLGQAPDEAYNDELDGEEYLEDVELPLSAIPFQFALDSNDRISKWFWSFASAAVVTAILLTVVIHLLLAPQLNLGIAILISAAIAVIYGAGHATWRLGKVCRAIHIDYDAIRLTYGSREFTIDPASVDAVMALSGIDLNGDGRGFSTLRRLVILTGAKVEKISFEPISNGRIFDALREACLHAWSIPAEGTLLPPAEIAEHHADRAGIDSLRRLRKYYGQFTMQLAFSSLSLIVLMIAGITLVIFAMGGRNFRRGIHLGGAKLLFFAGGIILAALSSLRRLPREFGILRKIKETEKSLAAALGLDFARS